MTKVHMNVPARVAFGVLAAALAFSGCSSADDAARSASKDPQPTSTTSARAFRAGDGYVALGSSFASGVGIPEQGPSCGRSSRNYPHLLAAVLDLELTDVTCAGATTANLLNEPQGTEPAQIDAVGPDTALVTLTAGGNDVQYSLTTLVCGGAPEDCVGTLDKTAIDAALASLPAKLSALVDRIRSTAPKALIVLVGYPRVVPSAGADCAALHLSANEADYIGQLGERLDAVFVDVAKTSKLEFIDAYTASRDHGPCAGDDARWVEGRDVVSDGFPFHPNGRAHAAIADLLAKRLAA